MSKMVIKVDINRELMKSEHNTVKLITEYDGEGRIIQEVMHDDAPEYNKKEKINLNEEIH